MSSVYRSDQCSPLAAARVVATASARLALLHASTSASPKPAMPSASGWWVPLSASIIREAASGEGMRIEVSNSLLRVAPYLRAIVLKSETLSSVCFRVWVAACAARRSAAAEAPARRNTGRAEMRSWLASTPSSPVSRDRPTIVTDACSKASVFLFSVNRVSFTALMARAPANSATCAAGPSSSRAGPGDFRRVPGVSERTGVRSERLRSAT